MDIPQLSRWESFYVIVGSAAGAMIGLQFVVITLVVELRQRTSADTIRAFGTSTVIHFTGAFVISALMSIPWASPIALAITLKLCGLAGIGYGAAGIRRALRQKEYTPDLSDWVWFFCLPITAYTTLIAAAFLLPKATEFPFFLVGGVALWLVFIGIRNVWDSVTYMILTGSHASRPRNPH